MPIVDVTLNHRVYPIACDEGQEDRVRHIARYLQQQVKEVRNQAPGATDAHLLVMVCLMLADELTEARSQKEGAGGRTGEAGDGDAEAMAAMVASLAERIETIAQRLEQA